MSTIAFAIFANGGKQYKAAVGDTLFLEKLPQNVGDKVTFDQVLMIDDKVGAPLLANASVVCVVEKQGKGPKIRVVKFTSKKHHHKRQGHRQPYTKVKVEAING